MFISKRKHHEVVEAYEKQVAALELECREVLARRSDQALETLQEKLLRVGAEDALATALAATRVALKNAESEKDAAEAALARYLEDYAPRALEPVS